MVNYLMIFGTMTHAQKAARLLDSAGITALIQRAPHKLTEKGCSYAVKVSENRMTAALSVLTAAGMPPVRVFSVYKDGSIGMAAFK